MLRQVEDDENQAEPSDSINASGNNVRLSYDSPIKQKQSPTKDDPILSAQRDRSSLHTEESFDHTDRGTSSRKKKSHVPEPMYEVDENMQKVRVVDSVQEAISGKKSSNEEAKQAVDVFQTARQDDELQELISRMQTLMRHQLKKLGIKKQNFNSTLICLLTNCEMTMLKAYTDVVCKADGSQQSVSSLPSDENSLKLTITDELKYRPIAFFRRMPASGVGQLLCCLLPVAKIRKGVFLFGT